MKSPLPRFLGGDKDKDKRRRGWQNRAAAQQKELIQAEQDMNDMRDWCESLLSAAASAANSAHEFSEAIGDLGTCLLQKAGENDDEEIGQVLLMLGKAQFILQKRLHDYRGHVIQTIQTPTESIGKELNTLEEMKKDCDERRFCLESMMSMNKEKRKSKGPHSVQELLIAQEAYEQEVNGFAFRLKSLKQGQCQSLLTQAVRHHSAQLSLFRKGVQVLESVEPHVKQIAAEQHIECVINGLEDDGSEEDGSSTFDSDDDTELSFDYGRTETHEEEAVSNPKHMVQDVLSPSQPTSFRFQDGRGLVSQSAPIYSDGKFVTAEKLKEMHASLTRKSQTYVLPTPTNSGNLKLAPFDTASLVQGRKTERETQLWHSSSLETLNITKMAAASYFSDTTIPRTISVLKEHNYNTNTTGASPPLAPGRSHLDFQLNSGRRRVTRHAFSGPLTRTEWSGKLSTPTDRTPVNLTKTPQVPQQHTSKSPRVSPRISSPLLSPPKINELHALPKPPLRPIKSSNIRHSAPLVSGRGPECFPARRPSVSFKPTPLPTPPGAMVRSFSIPSASSSQRMSPTAGGRLSEVRTGNMFEEVTSPPLTPMALLNIQPMQTE